MEAAACVGGIFWPFMGLALLAYHRCYYGVTHTDRRLARTANVSNLRRALEESRQRELERMERELGIKDR